MQIERHKICNDSKPFIIAEVSQNHDGSLGLAHSFIDAAADAGADAIKFQTHIASQESTKEELFRVKFSYEDANRYDYWKRMEFTKQQWQDLAAHAKEKNIVFLSSAFSTEAVNLLNQIGMPAWKIGSGEFFNPLLLNAIMATGAPLLISTGMSTLFEVEQIVKKMHKLNYDFALFQCTSMYPTPLEKVGLNILEEYSKFNCPIGLSDNSGTLYPALAAMSRGCSLIEVHVTFDKKMFGPDIKSSITFSELKFLAEYANALNTMNSSIVNKDSVAKELQEVREIFSKSLIMITDLSCGDRITENVVTAKKPGNGILVSDIKKIVGQKLKVDVSIGHRLKWSDFE